MIERIRTDLHIFPGGRAADIRTRPRLAFLTNYVPWKRNSGAVLRDYWLIRGLARAFDIDLMVSKWDGTPVDEELLNVLRSVRCTEAGSDGTLRRLRESMMPGRSYLTSGASSESFDAMVRGALATEGYDAVIFELWLAHLVEGASMPLVLNAHNCETRLMRERSRTERFPMRQYVALEAERLRAVEARAIRSSAAILACSRDDIADLAEVDPVAAERSAVVPNGIDVGALGELRHRDGEPGVVTITGTIDWRPNQLAVNWFIDNVLPHLRRAIAAGSVHVVVAGRMGDALAARLRRVPGLSVVANPTSMRPVIGRAQIIAAPILAASGTRLRILEAWAAGRPVVTTSAGALGLPAVDGANIAIADDAQAFALTILRLVNSPTARTRIAEGGAAAVADFDWRAVGASAIEALDRVVRVPIAS